MASDLAAVQAKYAQEAQKRLRPEGSAQFEELQASGAERLRRLADDVWADHAALDARAASAAPALRDGDRVRFLIAGAGIGGVVQAARLVRAGFPASSIRLVDPAGGVGGTWYWNRYPGLHCDVEASVYLPLLEELGFVPSHRYASAAEIRAYLDLVLARHGLADSVLFRATLERLAWDARAAAWTADIAEARGPRGEERTTIRVEAQFAFLTAGLLARPQVPKLGGVGLAGFRGEMLHTARWDYGVTGGSSAEPFPALDKLRGKRVGVLGTGATAVQAVPCLAEHAAEVFVFQRTASAVFERGQRPVDRAEWERTVATKPGWQRERLLNYAAVTSRSAEPGTPNLVDDEWTHQEAYAALTGDPVWAQPAPEKIPEMIGYYLAIDEKQRVKMRARTAEIVQDKETAEKLTPWYPVWCKRPTFSDTYLQTFNRPNVHLVDTDGKGIESVTERGLVAPGGVEYPLDVLVLSTGFISPAFDGGDPSLRAGVTVVGRDGRTLSGSWAGKGAATLHGIAGGGGGFPNLFWLGPCQSGTSSCHSYVLATQAAHAAHIIAAAHARLGLSLDDDNNNNNNRILIEVEEAAEEAWSMRCAAGAARFASQMACTPSYVNNQGHMAPPPDTPQAELFKQARRSPWSSGMLSYVQEVERWEAEGSLEGIAVTTAAA
ncbi:hypothetical protein SLS62_010578 [Diatrype stigma]|uniref:Uncharacterized protein n=1 Tax=Diatrype stigma TaxID=117547 RepID=A0AAN9YHR0_9PEZI